jgi:hypothetical protein
MTDQSRYPIGRLALECLEPGSDEPFVLTPERSITLALALTVELEGPDPKAALRELSETAHFVAVELGAPEAGLRILDAIRMVLASRRSDARLASVESGDALRQKGERLHRFAGQAPVRTAPMIDRDRPTLTVAAFPRRRIGPR